MGTDHITWAGRTLSGMDRFGVWKAETPDGWWDSPESTGDSENRSNADGEYDLPTFNAARLLTYNGLLEARSHADLHEAGIYLTGAQRGRLQVAGHGPDQWADAKRSGSIRFTPITDTLARWQVPLRCVDPRKFGELNQFTLPPNTNVPVFHRGNYEATPYITVTGTMPSYTLTVNGWNYAVSVPVVAGRPHFIDYNDGLLRINGAVTQNSVGNTNLINVLPGEVVTARLTSTGTGSATFDLLDTYI